MNHNTTPYQPTNRHALLPHLPEGAAVSITGLRNTVHHVCGRHRGMLHVRPRLLPFRQHTGTTTTTTTTDDDDHGDDDDHDDVMEMMTVIMMMVLILMMIMLIIIVMLMLMMMMIDLE